VAAAGLADVGARDPQPPEVPRPLQHPLEQLAVARLDLLALSQGAARRHDPAGEPVADGLEAAEAQRPRLARRRGHRDVDLDAGEGLGHERRQLPLEAPDLAPQLGARGALVAAYAKLSRSVSVEQIRHNPTPSVDHRADSDEPGSGRFQRRRNHP
jgi:hypothetical protein